MGSYEILSIGTKLKNLREKYNVKQEDISGKEITRNLISQIEHDKANLTQNAAEIILKNLKNICGKRHITIDENIEYLMENEKSQANKILDKCIKELKDLMVYKDNSFINKLAEIEAFLVKWNITDKKIAIFELAGDYYCNINDYYKSSLYYEKARALFDIHSKNSIGILRKLSMVYFYMGKYKQDIKCCQFALDWFNDDLTKEYHCIFLFNSALCYIELKEYDNALTLLNTLEPLTKDLDTSRYYDVIIQKSVCLQLSRRFDESLKIYNEALKFISKKNIEKYLLIITNITEIYIELHDFDKAKNALKILLDNLVTLDDSFKYSPILYCELGKIYRDLTDLKNAEKYFLKSLYVSKKQSYYFTIKNAIIELSSIYVSTNNVEKLSEIKNEFFILTSQEKKLSNDVMLILIKDYLNLKDTNSIKEIIDFSQKFIYEGI